MSQFISVIIPAYNAELYIAKAIESVLDQTYKHFELIIVDDGSTDRTADIVQNYAERDGRVKYFYQENTGVGKASNKCIELAKGDIIARMDADDIMLPNRLEEQYQFLLKHPEISAVSCLAYYINSKDNITGRTYSDILTIEDCNRYLKEDKIIFCLNPGTMFLKQPVQAVGGYNEEVKIAEDIDLWNRLLEHGYYTVVMPEILMKYRIHKSSATFLMLPLMLQKKWIIANIRRRRKHLQPLAISEFITEQKQTSYIKTTALYCKEFGGHLYRLAGYAYGERDYFHFILYLLASIFLRPKYVLFKVLNQKFRTLRLL
ncbi:glycosyltransferase [Cesiribacter sp. SM1]|uniref:glycosyltransferase family 2 protein n=1 Tax=Cesiribacter sp. SM1 TaxID=2861196 RepID=UPI001CD4AA70|nr:glycosyltransferase [Cesiribacter sp. SM1]